MIKVDNDFCMSKNIKIKGMTSGRCSIIYSYYLQGERGRNKEMTISTEQQLVLDSKYI